MERRSGVRTGVGKGGEPLSVKLAGRAFCQVCEQLVGAYVKVGDRGFRPYAVTHAPDGAPPGAGEVCPGSHCLARPPGLQYYRGAWLKPSPQLPRAAIAAQPPTRADVRAILKTLEQRLDAGARADARRLAHAIDELRALLPTDVATVGLLMAVDAILERAAAAARTPGRR